MSRLEQTFLDLKRRGEKAAGFFLTCGYPTREATLPLLQALDEAGADFLELGMPFSDPLAEGPTIQHSSERALENGIRMRDVLETARAFRKTSDRPLLLMGYINPVNHYGTRRFVEDASAAGVDGLIIPDLPPEEAHELKAACAETGLDLILLVAPTTTDDRLRQIDGIASGFIYAVSIAGVTGAGLGDRSGVEAYLQRVRSLVSHPVCVGFGIATPEDAARLSAHTDGFIVGSALIRLIEKTWGDAALSETQRLASIKQYVQELKSGIIQPAV